MLDVPKVAHSPERIVDLASRSEAKNDRSVESKEESTVSSCDDTQTEATVITPENTSSDHVTPPQRKPKRIHRVGHRKTKQARECNTAVYRINIASWDSRQNQRQSQRELKSTVDKRLGGTDPFGAFELPQDSTTDLALHHWANVFQNTRMPITPRKAWMKINLSDQTLLSVTTYCSASHFYFIRGMRAPPACIAQKIIAIRNINRALQKPSSIPSDYTMVAVAVMTLLECLAGEPSACLIHRKGLQLMVQSRGGLQNLGFEGAAQRTISWADTCCGILLRTKPSLQPILIPDAGESAIHGFSIGDLKERLLPITTSSDLNRKIIYIWLRLRYLTEFLTRITSKNTSKIDEDFFSDKIDFVERHALSVLHSEMLDDSGAVSFLTAFINASLIYIYEELRECPKWNNICICLSERIYSGLQMVDLVDVATHCPDLLLWVLLLERSGNSPLGERGKVWFIKAIDDMENAFDIQVPRAATGLKYFKIAEEMTVKKRRGGDLSHIRAPSWKG